MHDDEKIKVAFDRSVKALRLKPSLGLGTGTSTARIVNGLTCEVTEGPWKLISDMPQQAGGNGAGPTPGVYGRAALGSCLAIGYAMRAASMQINVSSIEVSVEADYDDGVLFGTSEGYPGYKEVRYTVSVETDAPEDTVLQWLDACDAHSPYLDVFARGQKCARNVQILSLKKHS